MLKPITEEEKQKTIKAVVSAVKNIEKLNKRAYHFLYLCSGFYDQICEQLREIRKRRKTMKTNTYKDNIKKIVEINNKKRQASLIELLTKTAFTDGQLDILRTVHLKRP